MKLYINKNNFGKWFFKFLFIAIVIIAVFISSYIVQQKISPKSSSQEQHLSKTNSFNSKKFDLVTKK